MSALPFAQRLEELIEGYEDDVLLYSRYRDHAMHVFKQLEAELTMLMPTISHAEKLAHAEQIAELNELRRRSHKVLFIEGDLAANY